MTRLIGILSTYALQILGAALLLVSIAWAVQTWRIGNLQERVGSLASEIDECVRANKTNQETIEALRDTAEENAAKYAETLRAQRLAVDRARKLEVEITEKVDDDIEAIQNTDDACANTRLPDSIRLRLSPRSHQDGGSTGDSGKVGPGRPGADPGAGPARP